MQTKMTIWTEIFWWELRRLFFNFILLVSGLFLLYIIQTIKPINSHLYFKGYLDLIFAYGLFVNFGYTVVYVFLFRLVRRFDDLKKKNIEAREFTFRAIVLVGLLTNFFAGVLELMYRQGFMK
jgi:hypothetical protein